MKYREIYKVLERRWQISLGFRFTDMSGWRDASHSYISHCRPLWIIIEDRASMRRIWLTQEGSTMEITYVSMGKDGGNYGESHRIRCRNRSHMAQELERLFVKLDQAA